MAKHECFWDMRARAYKNHNDKITNQNAWRSFVESFGVSGKKCEKSFAFFIQIHIKRERNYFYL